MDTARRGFLKLFGAASVVAPTVAVSLPSLAEKSSASARRENGDNPFEFPTEIIPAGMVYQWKRAFIDADTHDAGYLAQMVENGWSPVPASRHRDVFGMDHHNWIEVGGLVLMEKRVADQEHAAPNPLPFATRCGSQII